MKGPSIKRSGKSGGGRKGKVGTSNIFTRKTSTKSAKKIKQA